MKSSDSKTSGKAAPARAGARGPGSGARAVARAAATDTGGGAGVEAHAPVSQASAAIITTRARGSAPPPLSPRVSGQAEHLVDLDLLFLALDRESARAARTSTRSRTAVVGAAG